MDETPVPLAGGFLIDTDDLDQLEAQIGAAFGAIRVNRPVSGAITRTRVWRNHLGAFSIDDAEYTYDLSYQMEMPADILLCRVRSGVLEETLAGQPTRSHGTGAVVALGTAEERPVIGGVHRARYHMFNVPREMLAQVASDDPDSASVCLTSSTPVSEEANRYLVDVIDHIRHGLLSSPYAMQEPLVAGGVTRYLASSILAAFPHTVSDRPRPVGDADSYEALHRAAAFIDDNADTDISPADIANAARVSTPALEAMFRKHRGCSLTQHLHRVRLAHVHHDLETASPDVTTVVDIARRWGFWNLGHFETAYCRTFAVSAESTLNS